MALFKVEICGVNTSKLPLLTEDEKKELFKEIKKGNEVAREKYIRGNLRLVLSILQRFSNSNENVDDLFQIGCIGLIKAVDNFDDTLNVKFSTYAVPMISGELKRYLRDNAAIRVSRSIKDIAYKAIYCKENIIKTTHREPTVVEIAKEIGVEPEDVVYALDAIQSPVSLYDPVYDQGGDTLYVMDQISDKKNKEEKWVENIVLNEALKGFYGDTIPEDVGIFSTDLTDETIASMQNGEYNKMCVAITGNAYVCGDVAYDLVVRKASGEEMDKNIYRDLIPVTIDNLDEMIAQ